MDQGSLNCGPRNPRRNNKEWLQTVREDDGGAANKFKVEDEIEAIIKKIDLRLKRIHNCIRF